MASIEERVESGARWLDEHRPGWWRRIDLDTLDLGDPCKCVLGQEYGDFSYAPVDNLGHPSVAGKGFNALAFIAPLPIDYAAAEKELDDLTAEWCRLIEHRRVDDPDEPPTTITIPVGDLL